MERWRDEFYLTMSFWVEKTISDDEDMSKKKKLYELSINPLTTLPGMPYLQLVSFMNDDFTTKIVHTTLFRCRVCTCRKKTLSMTEIRLFNSTTYLNTEEENKKKIYDSSSHKALFFCNMNILWCGNNAHRKTKRISHASSSSSKDEIEVAELLSQTL